MKIGTFTQHGIYIGLEKSRIFPKSEKMVHKFQNIANGVSELSSIEGIEEITELEWNKKIEARNYLMALHFENIPAHVMD